MKISNKDLSSLADTTKATTVKINDINEENLFNEEISETSQNHPMALVIEDDKPSEINVVSELKKKNFLYKTAKTVDEGIEVYKKLDKQGIKIDVLFLDIVLKDKSSGIEFLKIIRANHWMENTFIIVMSSLEDSKVVNECYKYKIENFLHKPIKKKEFQIEERKIFNYLKKIKCPIDGYTIVKLLDKTQAKESHLVKCEKTKDLFLLKKIYCSNNILAKDQDLLNEMNNNEYCSTIIKLIASKTLNKCNYLIVEYSEFGPLSKKILDKKEELNQERYLKEDSVKSFKQMFDTEQILLWVSEVILALYSLHEKEIMHKDIKVENIYIFSENLVKIKNLYLVRLNEQKKKEFNSLIYMPPEMFSFQEYTCYTDIWDLGIVLYELVMLEKPFQGINSDELKNNIINEKYIPFPEEVDYRLKRLLELTLAFINHRASAARLLELKFIRTKIDYLYKNKIIDDSELYKKICSLPLRENDYKFSFEKKTYDKKLSENNLINALKNKKKNLPILTQKESNIISQGKNRSTLTIPKIPKNKSYSKKAKEKQYKEYDYYRLFRALMYIVFLFPKKVLSKGLFSEVEELIEEYYIRNLDEEWGISDEDIQDLIDLGYISEKKIANQKFFTFQLFTMKNVDNSINFPEEPQYLEYLPEPVTLTCKLLLKMKDVFKDCRYLLENEFATEKDKIKIITSKKIYHTYTCIKLLSKIHMENLSKNEKLSIILNLYQIMCFHFIIKQIVTDYSISYNENKKKSLLIEMKYLIQILDFWHTNTLEITYNINGELITLYELKHIVLRRNRIPPRCFLKLAYKNDPRINFLEGEWEDFSFEQRIKILCLCFDPVDLFDDKVNEIMQPLGICFNDKTFDRDLDNSFHLFVKENIWIDDNNSRLNVPYYLKEYLYDLDNNENKMIDVLLQELYKEPFMYKEYRKNQCRLLAGKIVVRYYKEYDRPQRII
jgi:serine/threonine protein kinase